MTATDVLDRPAMSPPPGVVPNFDDPPNQNAMALAVITLCLVVSTVAIALRLYSRWAVVRMVQWQDYLLLASFAIYIAVLGVLYRLSDRPGWFIHSWDLRVRDVVEYLHIVFIGTYLFLALLVTLKTAILMEWIRIFLPNGSNRRNPFLWACYFVIWANIIFCVVSIIMYSLACVPFEYLWDATIEGGYCRFNTVYFSLSTACFVSLTDMIILFIPQYVIWKLHITRRRKVGISFVFALGMAACAASVLLLYYAVRSIVREPANPQNADLTYHVSSLMLTTMGEGACAILALCIPAVPNAYAGLKSSGLLPKMPSWSRIISIGRCCSSREPRTKKFGTDGVTSAGGAHERHWQIQSSSEHSLVPLEHVSNTKDRDPELANGIVCTTEFEAKTSYEPERTVFLEQRSRQHPWMQKQHQVSAPSKVRF